jgi:hypothetical protein
MHWPAGGWGFASIALVLGVLLMLFNYDVWGLREVVQPSTSHVTTLLCVGGQERPCCDPNGRHASAMTITINHDANRVYVFVDGHGAGNGEIHDEQAGYLLFGQKTPSCDDPSPDACKVARGEINRLTGTAEVTEIDRYDRVISTWDRLECRRQTARF